MQFDDRCETSWLYNIKHATVSVEGYQANLHALFRFGDLLPAGGAGLRLLVSETYGVNVSIDYARGKDSDAIYVQIGEAF